MSERRACRVVGVARSTHQFRSTRKADEGRDHVWAWDFAHDRTADGKPLKWLSVVDEYTRECLALEVGRGLTGRRVAEVLGRLFADRGVPAHIRSDNGPEFIARAVRKWVAGRAVEVLYIAPGSPWENGYAESFHGKVRDEFLAAEEFGSLREAAVLGAEWRRAYNHDRPHSSLGYKTPAEYGASCPRYDSASLRRTGDTKVAV